MSAPKISLQFYVFGSFLLILNIVRSIPLIIFGLLITTTFKNITLYSLSATQKCQKNQGNAKHHNNKSRRTKIRNNHTNAKGNHQRSLAAFIVISSQKNTAFNLSKPLYAETLNAVQIYIDLSTNITHTKPFSTDISTEPSAQLLTPKGQSGLSEAFLSS